jgi:uncharacterized membrane protein YhdT
MPAGVPQFRALMGCADHMDGQFGFPLGVPTWYLFACVVPALVFLVISIVMALRMQEVDV